MIIPALVIHNLIPFNYDSRMINILIMLVLGIIMLVVYFYISSYFKLPQIIFELEDNGAHQFKGINRPIKTFKVKWS